MNKMKLNAKANKKLSFEEQFPSLKRVITATAEYPIAKYEFVDKTAVQEHCLDKQRVKEAFKDIIESIPDKMNIIHQKILDRVLENKKKLELDK